MYRRRYVKRDSKPTITKESLDTVLDKILEDKEFWSDYAKRNKLRVDEDGKFIPKPPRGLFMVGYEKVMQSKALLYYIDSEDLFIEKAKEIFDWDLSNIIRSGNLEHYKNVLSILGKHYLYNMKPVRFERCFIGYYKSESEYVHRLIKLEAYPELIAKYIRHMGDMYELFHFIMAEKKYTTFYRNADEDDDSVYLFNFTIREKP